MLALCLQFASLLTLPIKLCAVCKRTAVLLSTYMVDVSVWVGCVVPILVLVMTLVLILFLCPRGMEFASIFLTNGRMMVTTTLLAFVMRVTMSHDVTRSQA